MAFEMVGVVGLGTIRAEIAEVFARAGLRALFAEHRAPDPLPVRFVAVRPDSSPRA
jgi:3-hydroxyacyl-CoA dehydrogenase